MGYRTKLDYSSNRQISQREKTDTSLSGATIFGLPFSGLTVGPDLTTSGVTEHYSNVISTFSGNSTTTVFNWFDSRMELGYSSISAITPTTSGVTQEIGYIYTGNSYTVIDGNISYLDYNGLFYTLYANYFVDLGGGSYSGTVIHDEVTFISASSIDYSGRTIWVDNPEITRTNRLIISRNPQIGYVWTCIDSEGMGQWSAVSGSSSGSTIWTAGTGTSSAVLGGSGGIASGTTSVSEGNSTIAGGTSSHAGGYQTTVNGNYGFGHSYVSTIGVNSNYSAILGGSGHTLTTAESSIIIGGVVNNLDTANYSIIAGGSGNTITKNTDNLLQPRYSGIFAGFNNKIIPRFGVGFGDNPPSGSYCVIAGGEGNTISGHTYSFIGGGQNNLIACDAGWNAIIGGTNNVNHAANGVIIGGVSNTLGFTTDCPSAASNSIILGGNLNKIALTLYNTENTAIIGGESNLIDNTLADVNNTVILGGINITATTSNMVYVPDLTIDGLSSTDPIATDSSGKIVAGTSDIRLKQNVNTLTNSLNVIKNLRGVSFEYTPESNMGGGIRYGFIAQEVKEHTPLIVRDRAKGDGMLSLNYNEIVPILVEAVKELAQGTVNNDFIETQTILAEDNNIELNYNGTHETSLDGGITIKHGIDTDNDVYFKINSDGDFTTNVNIIPQGIVIPEYTPVSSSDSYGVIGNFTRDDNYLYIKTLNGWKRTNLENF